MPKLIEVEWTGRYPNLCSGHWIISVNGKPLPVPRPNSEDNMRTLKDYQTWRFNEDWSEEWEDYEDGMGFNMWSVANVEWIHDSLKQIDELDGFTLDDLENLYYKINEKDWRHNSCGGCI